MPVPRLRGAGIGPRSPHLLRCILMRGWSISCSGLLAVAACSASGSTGQLSPDASAPRPASEGRPDDLGRLTGADASTSRLSAAISPSVLVVCSGTCVELHADARGGNPPYAYSWGSAGSETAASLRACPIADATYRVVVRDQPRWSGEFMVPASEVEASVSVRVHDCSGLDASKPVKEPPPGPQAPEGGSVEAGDPRKPPDRGGPPLPLPCFVNASFEGVRPR